MVSLSHEDSNAPCQGRPSQNDLTRQLRGTFGCLWREIVRRGFALLGAAQFNLPVDVGRKAGRDARRFRRDG